MNCKISDLCSINESSIKKVDKCSSINYLDTSNLTEGKINKIVNLDPRKDKIPSRARRIVRKNDILYSTVRPNQLHYGFINNPIKNLICSTGFSVLSPFPDKVEPYYLYKYLSQKRISEYLQGIAETSMSTYPAIRPSDIGDIKIDLPGLQEQKAIAEILASLDDKLELNNKITKNLEEMAQALYKQWFIDFEFPNEAGEPYKSSGGEMIESELGLIPKGWEVKTHGEYFPVITGKKNANIAAINGKYKFFTCSQNILKTNCYSFEGNAILIAGNGDFNVKYYKGKFEAYQRTYVLIPYIEKLTGILFFAIKNNLNLITQASRGSVISFITKGHIENYKVVMPKEDRLLKFSSIFNSFLDQTTYNSYENEILQNLRDTLLPKLMSGEIRVPIKE